VLILQPELTVTFGQLKAFIREALAKLGLPDSDAMTVAALMAEADLQGSDGHGVTRLPQYARRIKAGGFNVRPNIRVVREQVSTALLNGDNGMGHLVMKRAAEIAIEKARTTGIAWVNAQFSNHAGPASLYATMPLAHDDRTLFRCRQRQPSSALGWPRHAAFDQSDRGGDSGRR
jgi:L-2-hydroxycarboxylate dehydrogenase (NAD+)